jgi:hypothetical protein
MNKEDEKTELELKEELFEKLYICLEPYSYGTALSVLSSLFLAMMAESADINDPKDIPEFVEEFSQKMISTFKNCLKGRLEKILQNKAIHLKI